MWFYLYCQYYLHETRYNFAFPTRNKQPPLATIKWFITTLRQHGYSRLYVQTDKGGELGEEVLIFYNYLPITNASIWALVKQGSL